MSSVLVHELFAAAARRSATAPAVSDGQQQGSYGELLQRSEAAARWLRECGLRSCERVVLHVPDDCRFVALLWGALRLGATVVPTSTSIADFHLRWILHDAAPALVVTSDSELSRVAGLGPAPVVPASGATAPHAPFPGGSEPPPPELRQALYGGVQLFFVESATDHARLCQAAAELAAEYQAARRCRRTRRASIRLTDESHLESTRALSH